MKRTVVVFLILALCALTAAACAEGGSDHLVYFGNYPQRGGDPKPIAWRVLAEQDDRVLLLSDMALASLPWHNTHDVVTWNQSDLRAWLNGEFLQAAFTEAEQAAIIEVELDNGDTLGYGTPVGENTRDRVFLLGADEALRYLETDDLRTVTPTDYAIRQGAYTNGDGHCAWWLRSPGMTPTSPAYFASGGSIGNRAHEVDETIIGVRPAIVVRRDALSGGVPSEAKTLLDWARGLDEDALNALTDQPLTATGIVTYVGTDIHGLPSFRLSDDADGACYVHACLASEGEYGDVRVGDTVTLTGNFHVLSNDWGVVLKNSMVE